MAGLTLKLVLIVFFVRSGEDDMVDSESVTRRSPLLLPPLSRKKPAVPSIQGVDHVQMVILSMAVKGSQMSCCKPQVDGEMARGIQPWSL